LALEQSGSGTTIALVVGLVSALATVIVALVNGRKSGRDARDNLVRDIELAKQLRDGSRAKDILEEFLEEQIRHLVLDTYTRASRMVAFGWFVLVQMCLITLLIRQYAADPGQIDGGLKVVAICSGVSALLFMFLTIRRRGRLQKLWPLDLFTPLPPSRFGEGLRNALRTANIRAAWNVLRTPLPVEPPELNHRSEDSPRTPTAP
jgi:hypothetical protein